MRGRLSQFAPHAGTARTNERGETETPTGNPMRKRRTNYRTRPGRPAERDRGTLAEGHLPPGFRGAKAPLPPHARRQLRRRRVQRLSAVNASPSATAGNFHVPASNHRSDGHRTPFPVPLHAASASAYVPEKRGHDTYRLFSLSGSGTHAVFPEISYLRNRKISFTKRSPLF